MLIIDKPAGMTSHDVVDVVRRALGTRKVGHAGTLDPDATGVLVLGVGRATRFLGYAQGAPKRYVATAVFGVTTTTQDASGEVVEEREAAVTRAQIEGALGEFTGPIEQIPPMVSAVKVGGERLYRKARRGEEVERSPRPVTIYDFRCTDFEDSKPPRAAFEITCSAGTYVRTLIHDLGHALGCGAHLATLRRTAAGSFDESEAVELEGLSEQHLRPLLDIVRELPRLALHDDGARDVSFGRKLHYGGEPALDEGDAVAVIHGGVLLGVYVRRGEALAADKVVGS